jgi:hypothetical protein
MSLPSSSIARAWCIRTVALVIACAGCERADTTHAVQSDLDPCTLVTQNDASAIFGEPASRRPSEKTSGRGDCTWGIRDHSLWSLGVEIGDLQHRPPLILVSPTKITYEGPIDPAALNTPPNPYTIDDVTIGVNTGVIEADNSHVQIYWGHGGRFVVRLWLWLGGAKAPTARSKIESLKRLAEKVDAELEAGGSPTVRRRP